AFEILEEKKQLGLSLQSILDPTWIPLKVSRDQVESTSESEGSASDEVLVVPYDNLPPLSCADIAKSKQLLDKLVVVKYNGALGKNMGFGGPK
ncbi:hypothetical protein Gotur_024871, partial [Gossypium turneri]